MIRTDQLVTRSFLVLGLAMVGAPLRAQMTSEAVAAVGDIKTDLTVRGTGLLQQRQDGLSAEMHFKDDDGSGTLTVFTSGSSSWLVYGRWKVDPTSIGCITTIDPEGGPPIAFDLIWTGDFDRATSYGEATEQNFGAFTFRTSGSLNGLSAIVSGHINGGTMIQTTGVLGDARSGNVTREIIATP